MAVSVFRVSDLMDLLCRKVGLPAKDRTSDENALFTDLGLDSLAFLQLQTELQREFGVEMPDDRGHDYTVGEIVSTVQTGLGSRAAA